MERRTGPITDGISRFLGILAILVSVGVAIFLYKENQTLKTELGLLKVGATEFNQNWDAQLTQAMTDFKTEANAALKKDDAAHAARNRIFNDTIAQLNKGQVDVEAIVDRKIAQLKSLAAAPLLRIAESRMSPIGEGDVNYVVIANDGDAEAEIEAVAFRPKKDGQFRITSERKMAENTDRLLIEFAPFDNKATTPGRHGNYERTYLVPSKFIPGRSSVGLVVEIQSPDDADHRGWGWEGELELKYDNGKSLITPIRAIFVAGETDTA